MKRGLLAVLAAVVLLGRRAGATAAPGAATGPADARKRLSLAQLRALVLSVGWPEDQADRAARIAMRESGGNPRAHLVVTQPAPGFGREDSRGLFQINVLAWPQYASRNLYDPAVNAATALEIYRVRGWRPWRLSSEATR